VDLKAVQLMGVPRGPRHVVRLAGRTNEILSFDPTRITPLLATISVARTFLAYDDFVKSKPQFRDQSCSVSRLTLSSSAVTQTVRSVVGTACGPTDTVNQVDFPRPPGRFSTPHL
jgi:hypothetical protein